MYEVGNDLHVSAAYPDSVALLKHVIPDQPRSIVRGFQKDAAPPKRPVAKDTIVSNCQIVTVGVVCRINAMRWRGPLTCSKSMAVEKWAILAINPFNMSNQPISEKL